MAVRPLFNGAARVAADNNAADVALRVAYVFRAQVGVAPVTTVETIANQTFEAEAGVAYTIFYDIRKFGAGVAAGQPDDAVIRIFIDDDNQDARTGEVASFDVLAAGLPGTGVTGSVTFTPTIAGTFRIQLELQLGTGVFGPTNANWRVISDGFFAAGGTAVITRAVHQDKGRLRSGTRLAGPTVTERGSPKPSLFAFTVGGEAVRIETTTTHAANKTSTRETFQIRQRRNGTSTIDADTTSTPQSATVQRVEIPVTDTPYPASAITYDTLVVIANNSNLHNDNTRQYDALGGRAASGVWVHLLSATTGTLLDFANVELLNSHSVNAAINSPSHLWQTDDDQMGTPPMSKHEASKSALVSSYSGMAMRVVNARGEGLNTLSGNMIMDPSGAGSTRTTAVVTATRGGEAGWTELVQLGPFVVGGQWGVALDITSPTSIDADTHLLNGTDTVTILAPDPRIQARGYMNLMAGHKGHFTEGDAIVINMTVRSMVTNIRIDPARVTEPKVGLVRYRSSDHRLEYLQNDLTTWLLWEPTEPMEVVDLFPSPNDPRNYIRVINNTTGWHRDITSVEFTIKVDGTPYPGVASREEVGELNDHQGFARAGWEQIS